MRSAGRAIGLDVHRDFCEVAICEDGAGAFGGPGRDDAGGAGLLAGSLSRAIGWRWR